MRSIVSARQTWLIRRCMLEVHESTLIPVFAICTLYISNAVVQDVFCSMKRCVEIWKGKEGLTCYSTSNKIKYNFGTSVYKIQFTKISNANSI